MNKIIYLKQLPTDTTPLPEDSPLLLRMALQDCLNWEPSRRPSFAQLVQRLEPLECFLAQHMQNAQVSSPHTRLLQMS